MKILALRLEYHIEIEHQQLEKLLINDIIESFKRLLRKDMPIRIKPDTPVILNA